MPTVLLADDHRIFIEGLQRVLESKCQLVGVVHDGVALLESAQRLRPDVIVTDISMPILNGIEAVQQLRNRGLKSRIIILSMHEQKEFAAEAFRAGAMGYLTKTSAAEELSSAIGEVMAGHIYITPAIAKGETHLFEEIRKSPQKPINELTIREKEVLQLVAEGRALKEMAYILGVTVRTVVFHKSNLMDKLGLRTTAELTQYAIRHKIISDQ